MVVVVVVVGNDMVSVLYTNVISLAHLVDLDNLAIFILASEHNALFEPAGLACLPLLGCGRLGML